jgi:hypothetical protein
VDTYSSEKVVSVGLVKVVGRIIKAEPVATMATTIIISTVVFSIFCLGFWAFNTPITCSTYFPAGSKDQLLRV